MVHKLQIVMSYTILLMVPLSIAGCGAPPDIGNIEWDKKSGSVELREDSIALHHSQEKTEMVGENFYSADLDCEFELEFDRGERDSSVGLEIWDPDEHSITFRGGELKVVTAGEAERESVKYVDEIQYVGKRITVRLKASNEELFATITTIDGDSIVDLTWPNTWSGRHKLMPRLNADKGDAITLYHSVCTPQ